MHEEGASIALLSEPNRRKLQGCVVKDENEDVAILFSREASRTITGWGSPGGGIVYAKTQNFVVFSCYISPNVSSAEYGEYLQRLEDVVRLHRHLHIIVGGDFNAKSVACAQRAGAAGLRRCLRPPSWMC